MKNEMKNGFRARGNGGQSVGRHLEDFLWAQSRFIIKHHLVGVPIANGI